MTKKKKKLLLVITKGNFGGAQRYVFDVATALAKEYEVTVASGEPGILQNKLAVADIHTKILPSLQRDISFFRNFSSIWDMVEILRETKPHILHANSSMAGFIASIAAHIYNIFYASERRKVKLIFTAHAWAFNENRSLWSKGLFYTLHSITVLLSSKTISVSQKTKKGLPFFPFITKKMNVVHNGIDAVRLHSSVIAREKLHPKSPFKTWIGTISELHKNKGLDIAIEGLAPILKKNPDIGFYIAGNGEERGSLEELVRKLGIEEQVVFLGYVEDAQKYLKAFDIFTLTSRTECFPYVLLEAGLAKRAVIATDVGGVSEIIDNLHSGMLIHPLSPIDVTHAVTYALEHKNELKDFGETLYKKVKKDLSVKKMLIGTKEIYEN